MPSTLGDPLSVLFVDDDEEDFKWTRKVLSLHAHLEFDWAPSCQHAFEAVRRREYDVLLVDYLMDDEDDCTGLDVVRSVRELRPGTPCILLTGMNRMDLDLESLSCGASDFINKDDASAATLMRAIRHAVERKKHEREISLRNRMLALIQRVTAAANSEKTAREALEVCIRGVCFELGFPVVNALMCRGKAGEAEPSLFACEDEALHERLLAAFSNRSLPANHPLLTALQERRSPVFFQRLGAGYETLGSILHAEDLTAALLVPLSAGGTLYGVVELFCPDETSAEPWKREVLEAIGAQVGLAAARESAEQDRIEIEAQLRQSQKREAIARLAGGVAHDFNNLLTVILAQAELLLESELEERSGPSLEGIRDAALKGANLTRQLLALGRRSVAQKRIFSLNELVTHAEKLLRRVIPEDIVLRLDLDPDLPSVEADMGAVEQVLLNLVINARDAIRGTGSLTIRTCRKWVDESVERTAGEYASLAVSDTGIGMSEEVLSRVFDPFFTTKGAGGGTGLGLPSAQGIVTQAGGYIDVETEVGSGTTFDVLLPARSEAAVSRLPSRPPNFERVRGSETVLVVEDEDDVRRVTVLALQAFGYRVVHAGRADEALALAREDTPIDLLLIDVVMPVMNGVDLALELRTLRPHLPVLFMSGYPEGRMDGEAVSKLTDQALLRKPFTPGSLADRVRSALDSLGNEPV